MPVNCTQTGRLLAGLMLALRWRRLPLDAGPVGRWWPSALIIRVLVTLGSGRREKPVQSTAYNSTADLTKGPDGLFRVPFMKEIRPRHCKLIVAARTNRTGGDNSTCCGRVRSDL